MTGDVGTLEADNLKPKADEQQQNEFQAKIHAQSDDEDDWGDCDELDEARENLMTYEKEGNISFEELEALMEYINQKLANKVTRQDSAKRLRSEVQLQFGMKPAMKDRQKHEQQEGMKQQSIFQ